MAFTVFTESSLPLLTPHARIVPGTKDANIQPEESTLTMVFIMARWCGMVPARARPLVRGGGHRGVKGHRGGREDHVQQQNRPGVVRASPNQAGRSHDDTPRRTWRVQEHQSCTSGEQRATSRLFLDAHSPYCSRCKRPELAEQRSSSCSASLGSACESTPTHGHGNETRCG